MRWFREEDASTEAIKKYAGLYRQGLSELDEEDVKAVQDLFLVRSVLES